MAMSEPPNRNEPTRPQRLSELLMAIGLATDLGTGQPLGHALRTAWLGVAIARGMQCGLQATRAVYQVALLRFLGCTADASETAAMVGGNDLAFRAAMAPALMGSRQEQMGGFVRSVGQGRTLPSRAWLVGRGLADPGGPARSLAAHCEVAAMLAGRLGLSASVVEALAHGYERWDGQGYPSGLQGAAIPVTVRIAVVARDADLFRQLGEDPTIRLRERSGHAYDPGVVDAFLQVGTEATQAFDVADGWNQVLRAEPEPAALLEGRALDDALAVFADFTDLASVWSRGHSSAVADLVERSASAMGADDAERTVVRRAALLHDVGRVGVESGIWDKAGALTTGERERVRLHPYFTQRVLERCAALGPYLEPAAGHHERLDGSGYHRGVGREELSGAARLLAAADVYAAVTAQRPYRPAFTPDEAARLLEAEVAAGRLDAAAVAAVLSASGAERPIPSASWPAGLTDREMEVLRLIARGHTNRAAARALGISPKTVGRHVENVYGKIGVTTRAAAAVFAMQHRLLG